MENNGWTDLKAGLFRSIATLTAAVLFLVMGASANQAKYDGKAKMQVVSGESN